MKIEELRETVELARVSVDNDKLEAVLPVFEQILDYFAVMEAAARDGNLFPPSLEADAKVPPGQDGNVRLTATGHFKPDLPGDDKAAAGLSAGLLDNAGERDGRFMVIPNVL